MRPFVLVLAILAAVPGSATAVEIHAHRGGPLATVDGAVTPVLPEETMEAFRDAHAHGWVVELDVKVTLDGEPVIIHDASLDRTTNCAGLVRTKTLAELEACGVDILGTGSTTAPNPDPDPIPTLIEVLDWAKQEGARLNLEIKNVPTDQDFDPTVVFAKAVVDALDSSGIAKDQVLVQSFWPANLAVAQLSGWETALLTLNAMNFGAPAFARANGYDWLSPEWPIDAAFMADAGELPVAPWTLNDAADIDTAIGLGVDAIISDNPGLVEARLGTPAG